MFLFLEPLQVLASYFEYWYFAIVLFKAHQKCLSSLRNGRNELKRSYLEMPGDWFVLSLLARIEGIHLEEFKDEMCNWFHEDGMKVLYVGSIAVYMVYMLASFCLLLSLHTFLKDLIFY